MGFSRQEYWSRLPGSPPGDLPDPGIEPTPRMTPALAGGIFTASATWEAFHGESHTLLHFVASLSSIFLFVSSLVFPIRQ